MFENDYFQGDEETAINCWTPATDIHESKDDFQLKVELPGISKEDVNVEFENGILTINGERKEEKDVKEDNVHRVERCYGTFSRSFRLPKNVNDKKISANMKDGILELKVPKAEEVKPKAIPINVN
jgi:HSP20 family protein